VARAGLRRWARRAWQSSDLCRRRSIRSLRPSAADPRSTARWPGCWPCPRLPRRAAATTGAEPITDNVCAPGHNLRNEKLSLTTTLITKLLTNALAQSQSAADSGDQSPSSGPANLTGRLSMAWKRSGFESPKLHSKSASPSTFDLERRTIVPCDRWAFRANGRRSSSISRLWWLQESA
jgi:hypothetical protein